MGLLLGEEYINGETEIIRERERESISKGNIGHNLSYNFNWLKGQILDVFCWMIFAKKLRSGICVCLSAFRMLKV